MAEFSLSPIIKPLTIPLNRCLDRATDYVLSKHPEASGADVNHDLKALVFDAASAMMVSTIALAYFKAIYWTTALVLIAAFYLLRRVVDETMPKEDSKPDLLQPLLDKTKDLAGKAGLAPAAPSLKEKIKPYFYQGDEIFIGKVVLLKVTRQPLAKVLKMIA
ncbi:MAG: hypothetical protein JSS10_00900 [Verrucomicrobia bacterium]|nr:hypothetical protein [Verrucomicrobiota bacterium]